MPETAVGLVGRIRKEVRSLDFMLAHILETDIPVHSNYTGTQLVLRTWQDDKRFVAMAEKV